LQRVAMIVVIVLTIALLSLRWQETTLTAHRLPYR
jgi:hypothetical protein